MSTFCAVDDATLIKLINGARRRVVYISPGIHEQVAVALGKRFSEVDGLDVTVVLDPDDDVCRIGYGDANGLKLLHASAGRNGFWVREQAGLRVGVLLADDQTLIWAPTPRSVESPPISTDGASNFAAPQEALFPEPTGMTPNGLLLGNHPSEQLAKAVAAEGINADPKLAEIGKSAITPQRVVETLAALEKNPPIPVDLQRITRVFSTKLQFVELTVKRAKLSQTQLTVPSQLLNADVKDELKGAIESRLKAFADLRDHRVEVPAFLNGEPAFGRNSQPLLESASEATLESFRKAIERKFIYDIPGYGRLIAKDEKSTFEAHVAAYTKQLEEHSKGLRELVDAQAIKILDEAVDLIMKRAERSGSEFRPDRSSLREELKKGLNKAKNEAPSVKVVFKDVTFEQTKSADFRQRVEKALPAAKRKQLGQWAHDFDAAQAAGKVEP